MKILDRQRYGNSFSRRPFLVRAGTTSIPGEKITPLQCCHATSVRPYAQLSLRGLFVSLTVAQRRPKSSCSLMIITMDSTKPSSTILAWRRIRQEHRRSNESGERVSKRRLACEIMSNKFGNLEALMCKIKVLAYA